MWIGSSPSFSRYHPTDAATSRTRRIVAVIDASSKMPGVMADLDSRAPRGSPALSHGRAPTRSGLRPNAAAFDQNLGQGSWLAVRNVVAGVDAEHTVNAAQLVDIGSLAFWRHRSIAQCQDPCPGHLLGHVAAIDRFGDDTRRPSLATTPGTVTPRRSDQQ